MITQKTKYALKSLIALGALQKGEALTIEEVAQRSGAPKRFLEHILLEMRRAGFLGAKRGRSGGYFLIRDAARISLGEILQQIDGPIAPLPCLSRRAYQKCDDCTDEETCQLRRVFGDVFWSYLLLIESLTLADLLKTPDLVAHLPSPPADTAAQDASPNLAGE
ncbi:Rrf2 family transcriptional regulator [Pseudooceanicola sediminis]|uniref:Rrf2 family transcriptional regulator n=1 Tax=Pseudooceanicola sediminis TaxID=2211117 RepID=A0A399IV99_9RHOB|nr:Rrf2 family transcriptional regulator [Pseudooceanicola sediminis]KAA2316018.1 Rrf2 family transcriptional regulator [Puniceibacterium sp. HSS470]RII36954.1 Rrf2 family transcriptional regulator [Pseudooceanicola sediminis]|tara:strand:+ start:17673 stop:18164 length:492 start_codon:yes stop_codon:yes gene_type:complete